jgi:hypothetical protein
MVLMKESEGDIYPAYQTTQEINSLDLALSLIVWISGVWERSASKVACYRTILITGRKTLPRSIALHSHILSID